MLNFTFKNTTEIIFGKNSIAEAKSRIPAGATILFIYGGGSIKNNGVYTDVVSLLEGFSVTEFFGVEPNPRYETLMKAVAVVKENNIDFILAVGGGSVIDGAKFVAAAAEFDGEPWDILEKGASIHKAIPLAAVLTLPATGTESNGNAVITRSETHQKLALTSEKVQPVFSVLDPVYTFTLPTRQAGNGVVDAFVHTIEQYLTYPVNAPLQDRFAEAILLTLVEEGPKVLADPTNYDVRANVMWSATMALNGLIGKGVPQDWATHMIGHELTALYGLDHAQTLAIVLPAIMIAQRKHKHKKIVQLGKRVFGLTEQNEEVLVDNTIAAVRDFFELMQVKTRFSDYGLNDKSLADVAKNLKRNGMLKLGEHGDITPDDVVTILTLAL